MKKPQECLLAIPKVIFLLQARRILLNLAENADLFNGAVPSKLRKASHLTTPDIAAIDEDTSLTLSVVKQRLQEALGLEASQCPYSTRLQVNTVFSTPSLGRYTLSWCWILQSAIEIFCAGQQGEDYIPKSLGRGKLI